MIYASTDTVMLEIPKGWQEVNWKDYVAMQNGADPFLLVRGWTGQTLTDPTVDLIADALSFISVAPEPYPVGFNAISNFPLQCYIDAREVARSTPSEWYRLVKVYFPDCKSDADSVVSRYLTINKAWDDLLIEFANLTLGKLTPEEIKAGFESLSVFQDYNIVAGLAGGDITKEEAILRLGTRHTFMHRSRQLMVHECQANLQRNRQKKQNSKR